MAWLVLSYSLPSKGQSSSRVSIWRRLKRLGALSVTGGNYLLPQNDDHLESFMWLAQEIRANSGEALVFTVERFEGLRDADLITRFHDLLREDYEVLETELTSLAPLPERHEALLRLRRRYEEMRERDYFDSPLGRTLGEMLERLNDPVPLPSVPPANPVLFRGRRWLTRPQPFIDRLACAWLIRRYLDPQASIRYGHDPQEDEVTFDSDGATFTHIGNLCTFEVMVQAFGLHDRTLEPLAKLVHSIDLPDLYPAPAEAAGVEAILRGYRTQGLEDAVLEGRGLEMLEALYSFYTERT